MIQLLARLRTRMAARTLAATTFCEECGGVCTPTCRHEALRRRNDRRVRDINLYLR